MCGVIGFCSSVPVEGRHIILPSRCMHNRGNGKGGGVAAMGLDPEQLGVTPKQLEEEYILQVAYLDPDVRAEVEEKHIHPNLKVSHASVVHELEDHAEVGLEVRPPRVWRYHVRAKQVPEGMDEDEFIYQNTFRLNSEYYASEGTQRAFVLSHGKNLLVFKAVGYAEQAAQFYKLEDLRARIWIAHQRYPTKGKVWHPGGAHPFIGLHEALVHNGDFANYYSISEYLAQRNIKPLYLTDTEVAALLFDLLKRGYDYPMEYVIEALAPTTDRDFVMLPEEKRKIYRRIQSAHMHGSPDGPWLFIVAHNDVKAGKLNLVGITDTSMLRPQVFALYEGEVSIGLLASERQAIDATLESLNEADPRFSPIADRYWNARGGSHTDGGAFVFSIDRDGALDVTDKFGNALEAEEREPYRKGGVYAEFERKLEATDSLEELTGILNAPSDGAPMKRSWMQALTTRRIERLLESGVEGTFVIDARGKPPEGPEGVSNVIANAYRKGKKRFIVHHTRGHRFIGCGLDLGSDGVRIDIYGTPGDYLASGLDGGEIHVHGSGQDQIGQILRRGKLVVHGDVGQTFMYGAKGGEVYILGNAAGRPLINAVGRPRVVVNGTCLDYLAESFMAGDPLNGGGFVIVNGLGRDEDGHVFDLEEPYPGGNLFSLASGGAIYLRDPGKKVVEDQLNGGQFGKFGDADWDLIRPYLEENERLFGIPVSRLLGDRPPERVYRKVEAVRLAALQISFAGE